MPDTDIFKPNNYQRICNNLLTEQRNSFQELRSLNDQTISVQGLLY